MPNFPNSGGGPNSGPGLNNRLQYVSGDGSDSNDGSTWSLARKTFGAALAYLAARPGGGGGEINFANGAEGNIWLRGDGVSIAGWHPAMSLRIVGHSAAHTSFGDPGATVVGGTTADRQHPLIWLAGCGSTPMSFENITPAGNASVVNNFFRSWDYKRKADASIAWANITNWNRTAGYVSAASPGQATVTVALPASRNILTASRTSNVVRLQVTAPAAPQILDVSDIEGKEQWIKVTMTDPGFNSGEFQVIHGSVIEVGGGVWRFDYNDPGSNVGLTNSPGTYQSSEICLGDRIEVTSTQSNVPGTAYKVIAVTDATHFTVRDVYGYGSRSVTGTWNNPGQYVCQNRGIASGLWSMRNCMANASFNLTDQLINGPIVDVANTTDGRIRFEQTSFSGMADPVVDCRDPDRACWLLMDPGAKGVCGATLRNDRPAAGGIRIYGSTVAEWAIDARNVQGDIVVGFAGPPALETIDGNSNGTVVCDFVRVVDQDASVPNIIIDSGMAQGYVKLTDCGLVLGPGSIQGGQTQTAWGVRTATPESQAQWGFWVNNKLAGLVPSGFRSNGGLNTARYPSKTDVPGSWVLNGATKTAGQSDPFGGVGAYKLSKGGGGANVYVYDNASESLSIGDKWVFSCWMRRSGGMSPGPGGYIITLSHGIPLFTQSLFFGDGEWQHHVFASTITAGGTFEFRAALGVADDLFIFQPTLLKIPASDNMSANEFAEFATYIRTQPRYLPAGMDGTGEDRKFIAHGGMGTNSANAKVVGVGSGQLTLTGSGTVYLPMYDTDGVTIIGWVAQLQATVNP